MGKQMTYWMDYESFLLLAQKALDLGCNLVKEDVRAGIVTTAKDIDILSPYGNTASIQYYVHCPSAGDIRVYSEEGRTYLDHGYSKSGNALIEIGYSFMVSETAEMDGKTQKKELHRARMYCISGYYDEQERYIPRSDELSKMYQALVRYVKKLAPLTEVDHYKIPISKECYVLVKEQGYKIV